MRPVIDLVDSTWLGARPAAVAAQLADPANWRRWWPDLGLRVQELRGDKGVRWAVDSVADAPVGLRGSAEVWLEPSCDGSIAHFFLRLDPEPGSTLTPRQHDEVVRAYRSRTKIAFWALGDLLDPGRLARHVSAARTAVGRPRPTGAPG